MNPDGHVALGLCLAAKTILPITHREVEEQRALVREKRGIDDVLSFYKVREAFIKHSPIFSLVLTACQHDVEYWQRSFLSTLDELFFAYAAGAGYREQLELTHARFPHEQLWILNEMQ